MDKISKHLTLNADDNSMVANLTTNRFHVTRTENGTSMLNMSDGTTVKYALGGIDGTQICLHIEF